MEVEAPPDPVKPEPPPGANEQSMHKNRLQEYAQRSSIQLPVYQTLNEGSPHAPKFRSTVLVDGMKFRSSETFAHRKEAEQGAAKIALEGIFRKIQQEGCPSIYSDMMLCKSILHEYAVKMNLERPTYTSSESEGVLPMFISSVSLDGNTYKGIAGRNKKQAEQLAARAAIESILGSSNLSVGTLMSQIIKSKAKLYAAVHQVNVSNVSLEINPPSSGNVETLFENSLLDGNQMEAALVNATSPVTVYTVGCALGHLSEEKQTKEDRSYAPSSDLIGSGAALQYQPQACPPLQQVNTCFQTDSDNPNFKLCGQGENETPVVDPSGLSTGTQRKSSRRKKKLYAAVHQVNVSNVSPEINPPSSGNVEALFENSLLDGKQMEPALVNATSPVAVHTVGCALGHLSEEKQTKEDCRYALSSDLIGSGAALQHQSQACPPLQHVNTCFQTASDNPNFKIGGQGENETPVVDPSGLSTGTQRASSRRKRKLSKVGKEKSTCN